ncbi:carbonic anhydrase 6-like isoform X2 [Belonocnema kinseyi]|uniref:carbonic anhydrase 6-like isoform X2 n=1 Tax=Belonocnema kinseyi TaxID=2817044 RepID=UPI00143D5E1A|nr:carbonic anhydrase 6-like isoform X2 [Belonocnema kinseyi]
MAEMVYLIGLPKSGQSPIDIEDKAVRPHRFPSLNLSGHWLRDGDATLINTGKTAKICLSGDRIPSSIKGGPLFTDEYEFQEVHFHWGKENCCGSEHTINSTWFSMEAHAVHWNRRYGTIEESKKHKDGLCVLAFLFLATDTNSSWSNPQLEILTDNLRYIIEAGSEKKVPANR